MKSTVLGLLVALAASYPTTVVGTLGAQQVADSLFRPPIQRPAYPHGKGPTVLVDEAHSNSHTITGRYLPFADLLRRDGYVVQALAVSLTAEALRLASVLVIANATSTFADAEVATVRDWVAGGGSLLLIADHTPFSEAAAGLATSFGVRFRNGVTNARQNLGGRLVFRRSDGTLRDHPITKGIDSVATFTGTSFQVDTAGHPLLVFGPNVYSNTTQSDSTLVPVTGHFQGAVLSVGRGKLAVFGEAAMFSAQLSGPDRHPMGMNASVASQNSKLVLNVIHWLTGVL